MTRRRRVAFVGNFGLWRKATMGDRSVPMARELRLAGHDAYIVAPREEKAAVTRPWGVPVRHAPTWGHFDARSFAATLRAVLSGRPDVVVCVKPKFYAGLIALLLAPTRIRVVVDADDFEAGWSALAGDPAPVQRFVAMHERAALRAADRVIAASRWLVDFVGREDVAYIPNATWPGQAAWQRGDGTRTRARLGLDPAEPLLLLYSRQHEFDPARLRCVLDRVPDARLLVLGADRFDLGPRAMPVGWRPREELPDLLAAADVALVPLDDTDVNRARCSVKLLDLMLAGRPIVADAVGETARYLEGSGVLVTPGDADRMASAARDLLAERDERSRMGAAAERAGRDTFTWERQRAALCEAIC